MRSASRSRPLAEQDGGDLAAQHGAVEGGDAGAANEVEGGVGIAGAGGGEHGGIQAGLAWRQRWRRLGSGDGGRERRDRRMAARRGRVQQQAVDHRGIG